MEIGVEYYLDNQSTSNLCSRITLGKSEAQISLGYNVPAGHWHDKDRALISDDDYYVTLINLRRYITKRCEELKGKRSRPQNIIRLLKEEIEAAVKGKGIGGLVQFLFDKEYAQFGIPPFEDFIKAFEKHSSLPREAFRAIPSGCSVFFHVEDSCYEMHTFEGVSHEIEEAVKHEDYEALADTYPPAWDEVYYDAGISKSEFIPSMLAEWEAYWEKETCNRNVSETFLKSSRERSWRQFEVFMACYQVDECPIALAERLDPFILYPLSLITMLSIFDMEASLGEYCSELFSEWTPVVLNEGDEGNESFFWIIQA